MKGVERGFGIGEGTYFGWDLDDYDGGEGEEAQTTMNMGRGHINQPNSRPQKWLWKNCCWATNQNNNTSLGHFIVQ
jgi:hypothetical protein